MNSKYETFVVEFTAKKITKLCRFTFEKCRHGAKGSGDERIR
jgi:hypothetical protein